MSLLLLLAAMWPANAEADQWLGWRGLAQEGRGDSSTGPTVWSADKNVRWRANIPGEGRSSPVVTEYRVIVTTAYSKADSNSRHWAAFGAVIALAGLLVLSCFPRIVRLSQRDFVAAAAFSLLLGLSVYALVDLACCFGGTDHKVTYVRWLQSGAVALLFLILAASTLPRASVWRLAIGTSALLFAVYLYWDRPHAEYYDLGHSGSHILPSYLTLGTISTFAVVLLATTVVRRLRRPGPDAVPDANLESGSSDVGSQRRGDFSWANLFVACTALIVGLIGFGFVPAAIVAKICDGLLRHGSFSLPAELSGFGERAAYLLHRDFTSNPRLIAVAGGLFAWLILESRGSASVLGKSGRWLPISLTLAGVLAFVTATQWSQEPNWVRAIACLDRTSGEVLWIREGLSGPKSSIHVMNSQATPTPICDGERIYAYFGSAGMMCTDLTGNVLWTNSELPFNDIHGVGASPLLAEHTVIILSSMPKAPYLAALDCATGEVRWTVDLPSWNSNHGQHRTPTLLESNGRQILLVWHRKSLRAYDAKNGEQLFAHELELPFAVAEGIASVIVDQDDSLAFLPSKPGIEAYRLSFSASTAPQRVWNANLKGKGPNTSSPLMVENMIFSIDDRGVASCVDAHNGEVLWRERISNRRYTLASPIEMGGKVYFCDETGVTTVVAADRNFQVLARNELPGGILATPAPVDGELFIRAGSSLWCIH